MEQNKTITTLEDLVKLSDENYINIFKENKFTQLLKGIGQFSDQSIKNTVLILAQNPAATCVKRMDDWNFYKRSVKKNEKSLKVISHYIAKNETSHVDEYGNTYTKAEEKLNLKVGHLFDISQTEGKFFNYLNTNKETIFEHFDSAKKALEYTIKNYQVVYTDLEGCTSKTDLENQKILILDGMTLENTLNCLIKEISNALILTRSRDGFTGLTKEEISNISEIESECVNYAVCSKIGFELPKINLEQINNFTGEQITAFKENLNLVRSAAHQLLSNFESAIERSIRDLDKKMKEQEMPENETALEPAQKAVQQEKPKQKSKSKTKESEVQE